MKRYLGVFLFIPEQHYSSVCTLAWRIFRHRICCSLPKVDQLWPGGACGYQSWVDLVPYRNKFPPYPQQGWVADSAWRWSCEKCAHVWHFESLDVLHLPQCISVWNVWLLICSQLTLTNCFLTQGVTIPVSCLCSIACLWFRVSLPGQAKCETCYTGRRLRWLG